MSKLNLRHTMYGSCGLLGLSMLTCLPIQAQFVSTATKALRLQNATLLGRVNPATPIHVIVSMKLRNASLVQPTLKRMVTTGDSLFGQPYSVSQFISQFAPTASQVTAVEQYLTANGFKNLSVEGNQLLVQADATAQQVETAFNTVLSTFTLNGKSVFANTMDAQVPTSLSSTVLAVLGLNNVAAIGVPSPPSTSNLLNGYTPADYKIAYDAWGTKEGTGLSIAIFTEGNMTQVIKDLRTFETANKLAQVPVTVVNAGIPSPDVSGADEWDLDTQSSTGIAPAVTRLYLYTATSLTDADTALTFSKFVTDNKAKAGSASYGECEVFPATDGAMVTDDELFAEAALQGQTVFASTGDNGAACPVAPTNGVPLSGPPLVLYPASSPYVIGVGGTDLFTFTGYTYDFETAWNAGGGGISLEETAPFWQAGVVPTSTSGMRGVPDVSMCADPNTCAANIYVDGVLTGVGGTSLASPLSLGVWARIESSHKNAFGFAGPLIYQLASGANTMTLGAPTIKGFHDVITGSNGYPATIGWDYATGLGSWDIGAVSTILPTSYKH